MLRRQVYVSGYVCDLEWKCSRILSPLQLENAVWNADATVEEWVDKFRSGHPSRTIEEWVGDGGHPVPLELKSGWRSVFTIFFLSLVKQHYAKLNQVDHIHHALPRKSGWAEMAMRRVYSPHVPRPVVSEPECGLVKRATRRASLRCPALPY